MADLQLVTSRIEGGLWLGLLSGGDHVPSIDVRHMDRAVPNVSVGETAEGWSVQVPIPAEAIADGVQTFVVYDGAANRKLADFTVIAGEALGEDIRAEVQLLRAELDMLKRAFRRHCAETD